MTRTLTAVVIALLAVLLAAAGASAHERRAVGNYQFLVGFLNEPPIVDEPNGVSLTVTQGNGSAAQPVAGLADALKVAVLSHGQSLPLAFEPSEVNPGQYTAYFIPTADGTYAFHITGSINGQTVDETFTSGPNTFDDVSSRASLSFPVKTSSAAAIEQTATRAQRQATTARLLGFGGLIVGVLGLAVGGAALVSVRRERAARLTRAAESRDAAVQS